MLAAFGRPDWSQSPVPSERARSKPLGSHLGPIQWHLVGPAGRLAHILSRKCSNCRLKPGSQADSSSEPGQPRVGNDRPLNCTKLRLRTATLGPGPVQTGLGHYLPHSRQKCRSLAPTCEGRDCHGNGNSTCSFHGSQCKMKNSAAASLHLRVATLFRLACLERL